MEGYFDTILNRAHRIWYTKISNHRFAVETVRFSKIPRDERLCLFCEKQSNSVIEDEKHVLLHCPRYESLRKELYNSKYELSPKLKNYGMMINLIIF